MKKLKSQSGRSMVEMLGVLAIIGVLSVGGIAGYSLSMRRHRANGVVDLMTKYGLIIYGQCQQKLLNGELDSLGYCSPGHFPKFTETDIGNAPSGVVIDYHDLISNTNGVDTIILSADFDDDKLCQAVGSITGTGCNDGNVLLNLKQN